MKYYSRSERVRSRANNRKEKIVRMVLLAFIFLGLGYSLYALFRSDDVYLSIEELISDKKFAQVDRLTQKLIAHNPRDVRVLRLRGKNYFLQAMRIDHVKRDQTEEGWDLFKKAVQSLKEAILLDKKGVVTSADYMIIGFSYMRKGDNYFDEALRYFKLAETHNQKDRVLQESDGKLFTLDTLYRLSGYLFYKTGRYAKALDYYFRANNQKKSVLNYLYIGLCQRSLRKYKEALATFKLVYDHASNKKVKIDSLRNLGWLYFHTGRYSEAAAIYERSVSISTNYAEGYYWIGMIASRRGDHAKARKLWQKCLSVDPHFGPAILKKKNFTRKKR